MRNPENKRRWEDIVTTTKRSLLSILIDDMEEQYQATKISVIDTQLRQHLTPKDWETLDRKYKAAVPGQVQRSQRIFPRDRKMAEAKRRNQRGPRNGQQGRPSTFRPRRGDDLSTLAKMLVKQMKASNNK